VPGVGAKTPDDPHWNLMVVPWWTDGNRDVYLLSEERIPLEQIEFFKWPD
jgi:hypothetical protein